MTKWMKNDKKNMCLTFIGNHFGEKSIFYMIYSESQEGNRQGRCQGMKENEKNFTELYVLEWLMNDKKFYERALLLYGKIWKK